jgi:toxin ParE1/3/4
MRLEFRPLAVADLAEIRDGQLQRAGSQAAENVRRHLLKRFNRLCEKPDLGLTTSHSGIRILSPTNYPYRFYFTVIEDAVVILHIRHTSRRLKRLDRL